MKKNTSVARLGQWLRAKKNEHRWSNQVIADRGGNLITKQTVSDVLRAAYQEVEPKTVTALAKAFNVSEDFLWSIVRGTAAESPRMVKMILELPAPLVNKLENDATRCQRDLANHLIALLMAGVGEDVNIDSNKIRAASKVTALRRSKQL
jgi:transcriptional regulator with XRE-family HTH domain